MCLLFIVTGFIMNGYESLAKYIQNFANSNSDKQDNDNLVSIGKNNTGNQVDKQTSGVQIGTPVYIEN